MLSAPKSTVVGESVSADSMPSPASATGTGAQDSQGATSSTPWVGPSEAGVNLTSTDCLPPGGMTTPWDAEKGALTEERATDTGKGDGFSSQSGKARDNWSSTRPKSRRVE